MLSGVAAFAYLALLWYAAPLFFKTFPETADRLRATIIAGAAVPGVLALLHVLYAPLLWAAVAALAFYRFRARAHPFAPDVPLCVTLAAVLIVCWPPAVRPLLDGDTLRYHLPIAVAFAQDHSLWTARAPYWFYPPASELFAGGLFVASGRWSLPLAGIMPALLIAARIYTVARNAHAPAYAAASIAIAFVCTPVAALEVGTLQNDLWLAAFFVEILAADRSPYSLAVCALLKPFGWIEALVAACAARVPPRAVLVGFVPLAFWAIRDEALLLHGKALGVVAPPYFSSTIAENVMVALPQLAHGIAMVTPQSFLWLTVLVAGLFVRPRRYAIAGIAALVIYALLPLAYRSGAINYVLDASSFRFALPALACAALVAAHFARRAPAATAIAGYAAAVWSVWSVLAIFWNDAYTRWAIVAAALGIAAAAAVVRTRGASTAMAVLAIAIVASWAACSRAAGFYSDWMRDGSGKPTGVFVWIAAHKPAAVVAENVRTGAILMMSPGTRAYDVAASQGCAQARRSDALLMVGSNEDLGRAQLARAVAGARTCGNTLYEDGAAVIVQPRRDSSPL